MDKLLNFYIESGGRRRRERLFVSFLTLDEVCDYAIRMEFWGLTYSRASEELLNTAGPV